MKRKRHSPEQIIRKLLEADGMLSMGQDIATVWQQLKDSGQASVSQVIESLAQNNRARA